MATKTKPASQAAMIRGMLAKKMAPARIVERVLKQLPSARIDVSYVNWIAKRAGLVAALTAKAKKKVSS